MREEISSRYERSLSRVRALVEMYRDKAGAGSGRRPIETADLLRAAVVFLHATLEDVLRTVLARKWPETTTREHLEEVPVQVAPDKRSVKLTLADLLMHRDKTVAALIRESIEQSLDRSNYNNVPDVKTALSKSGLDPNLVTPYAPQLAGLMSRRHQIVHRADRQDVGGRGNHVAASLDVGTVEAWIAAVDGLCGAIVASL